MNATVQSADWSLLCSVDFIRESDKEGYGEHETIDNYAGPAQDFSVHGKLQ